MGWCAKGPLIAVLYVFNKIILSVFAFEAQRVLVIVHQCVTVLLLALLRAAGAIDFPPLTWALAKRVSVVSAVSLLNVALSVASVAAVNIPMYTALRRLTAMFVILTDWALGVAPDPAECGTVAVMLVGSFVAGLGDLQFDATGYAIVMANNVVTALYLSLLKHVNRALHLNSEGTTFFTALLSLPLIVAYAFATHEFALALAFPALYDTAFQVTVGLSAVLAFGLNYSLTLCTQYNSPLTTCVVGQAKNVITTLVGLVLFDVQSTRELIAGLVVGLVGSGLYAYVKYRQSETPDGGSGGHAHGRASKLPFLSPNAPTGEAADADDTVDDTTSPPGGGGSGDAQYVAVPTSASAAASSAGAFALDSAAEFDSLPLPTSPSPASAAAQPAAVELKPLPPLTPAPASASASASVAVPVLAPPSQ